MSPDGIGGLPRRYAFILNPYANERISKCPQCERPTHSRKFALLVHVDKFGALAIGKTCRYCTPCELVIAHRSELDAELAHSLGRIAPEMVGNEYLVLGTMDKRAWQRGLNADGQALSSCLEFVAEFQQVLELKIEGGWAPA